MSYHRRPLADSPVQFPRCRRHRRRCRCRRGLLRRGTPCNAAPVAAAVIGCARGYVYGMCRPSRRSRHWWIYTVLAALAAAEQHAGIVPRCCCRSSRWAERPGATAAAAVVGLP